MSQTTSTARVRLISQLEAFHTDTYRPKKQNPAYIYRVLYIVPTVRTYVPRPLWGGDEINQGRVDGDSDTYRFRLALGSLCIEYLHMFLTKVTGSCSRFEYP